MRLALRMLMYLACMLIGAMLMATLFRPVVLDVVAQFLHTYSGRLVASGLAFILLLSPLAILLRWWQVMRRAREISYQTENGRISVSLQAIEEALTRALEGEPEVKKAHVRVFEDRVKRAVIIEAVMTLWEVPNVTDRNRFCQRLLRRRFAELMPEQTAVQVNLTVHRLTMRRPETYTATPSATPVLPAKVTQSGNLASVGKRDPETELPYRDPLLDSGLLPVQTGEEDLYVGPSYPVVKEDEEEASPYFSRPGVEKASKQKPKS
jgi:hypothetical protein